MSSRHAMPVSSLLVDDEEEDVAAKAKMMTPPMHIPTARTLGNVTCSLISHTERMKTKTVAACSRVSREEELVKAWAMEKR